MRGLRFVGHGRLRAEIVGVVVSDFVLPFVLAFADIAVPGHVSLQTVSAFMAWTWSLLFL